MTQAYRFTLSPSVDADPSERLCVIGLNPADDDSRLVSGTVNAAENFARDWDCGTVDMVNLFGARSTSPSGLKLFDDPVGPGNDSALQRYVQSADIVLAAWGSLKKFGEKWKEVYCSSTVKRLLPILRVHKEAYCLGLNNDGQPHTYAVHTIKIGFACLTRRPESFRKHIYSLLILLLTAQ